MVKRSVPPSDDPELAAALRLGATSRDKVRTVAGPGNDLLARLAVLRDGSA